MEVTGKGGKFPGPASNLLLMAREIKSCVFGLQMPIGSFFQPEAASLQTSGMIQEPGPFKVPKAAQQHC